MGAGDAHVPRSLALACSLLFLAPAAGANVTIPGVGVGSIDLARNVVYGERYDDATAGYVIRISDTSIRNATEVPVSGLAAGLVADPVRDRAYFVYPSGQLAYIDRAT